MCNLNSHLSIFFFYIKFAHVNIIREQLYIYIYIYICCNVARFSYEVFHDRIDQGIDSIRDTLLNFINDGIAFLRRLSSR